MVPMGRPVLEGLAFDVRLELVPELSGFFPGNPEESSSLEGLFRVLDLIN